MKPYTQMTTAELARATKQYDQMVIDKTRQLNARERKLWNQAKRGRGRPKSATASVRSAFPSKTTCFGKPTRGPERRA
jgi:hypothetical protein